MCNKCNSQGDSSGVLGESLQPLTVPFGGTNMVIGYYPSINGGESVPLQGIEPTLAEVKVIIRHHVEMLRAVDECWRDGQSGSWEIRQFPYSNGRINYYAQFVDDSEIQEIFDDVYKDFNANLPEDIHDEGANAHFNE